MASHTPELPRSEQLIMLGAALPRRDRQPSCSWAQGSWVLAEPFDVACSTASVQSIGLASSPGRKTREVVLCPRGFERRLLPLQRASGVLVFLRSPPLAATR